MAPLLLLDPLILKRGAPIDQVWTITLNRPLRAASFGCSWALELLAGDEDKLYLLLALSWSCRNANSDGSGKFDYRSRDEAGDQNGQCS